MWREMIIFADKQTIKQSLIQKLRPPFIHCGLWIVGERANIIEKDSNPFCPYNDEEGWEGQSHTVTAYNYESTATPTHSPHHDADRKDQAKLNCLWVNNKLESKVF